MVRTRFALILYFRMVAHKAACHTLSKAFLKSMKTWYSYHSSGHTVRVRTETSEQPLKLLIKLLSSSLIRVYFVIHCNSSYVDILG